MSSKAQIRWLIIGLITFGSMLQVVSADIFDDLEIHGFATQGFVKTSANSFFGDSEKGSFEFRELGVNSTFEPTPNIRVSGQILSRRAGEMYSGSPRVDFALADFTIRSTAEDSFGFVVGRIKNPLGFFNETRDVAFARPSMFLPQVIYFDNARNLIMSSDGAGVRMELFDDAANINLYLAAGKPIVDENVEYAFLGTSYSGEFEPDGISFVGRLLLETSDDRLRTSFSIASTSLEFERRKLDPIGSGSFDLVYWIASLQYVIENWTITTEYMREPLSWQGFDSSMFGGTNVAAEGYYLQSSWQAREDLELMIRYEEGFADRRDRAGKNLHNQTFGQVSKQSRYSKIATVGIRWDLSRRFMLRAEYQKHHGTFILSNRENLTSAELEPDWDMFAISASYRF